MTPPSPPSLTWGPVTLPVPPSANRYWRSWRGRVVRSAEAEAYCYAVGLMTRRYRGTEWPTRGAAVAVAVRWVRAKAAGDLDNRLKVLLDALQGVLYWDDGQVAELHAYRDDSDRHHPRVDVVAWRVGGVADLATVVGGALGWGTATGGRRP